MPIILIFIITFISSMLLFRSCGVDPNAPFRISYGSFLESTEVKNVYSYTVKDNCITYTYGDDRITETYCGESIEVFPQ